MRRLFAIALSVLALGALPAQAVERQRQHVVTIGTGPMRGSYYPTARAICRVVNRELRGENIRCSAEPTYGSVYNLQMMQTGDLDFALVQADVQHQALNGVGEWAQRPFVTLRSVFPVYEERVALVAAPGSGIGGVADLRGRRLYAGVAGSGTRATWDAIAGVASWQGDERVRLVEAGDIAAALCGGRLDAALTVGFHPVSAVRRQLDGCSTQLVPIAGALRDRVVERHPYFRATDIAAAAYGTAAAVPTIGMRTDFVTSTATDPRIVAAFLRAVLSNRAELREIMPAFAAWNPGAGTDMIAPLHPAAQQGAR
ncbi:TAXI family TRAP transporter solute-binding subunit [Roseomonas sp. AR75]|uniref:TAXI family TRAP transporter solute-binding subunit n=1 Tax=Roseomonas sp. AR75 TaxID=2562311 RepID=UPI0010C0DCE0|nr:TAXI family TRAP transporter solute-binding subunit [Roseomonas sp. AR75]